MACPLQRLVRRCSIYICRDCGATPRQQILSQFRFTSRTGTLLKPVSAQEQHQHHPGVVSLLAAGNLLVVPGLDLPQIPLSAHFQQKEHQVVLQEPVNRRGRQQAASARGFQGQEVLRMTYCIEQNRCSHYLLGGFGSGSDWPGRRFMCDMLSGVDLMLERRSHSHGIINQLVIE